MVGESRGGGSVTEFKPFLYTNRPGEYQVIHMGEVIHESRTEEEAGEWFDKLMARKDWRTIADAIAGPAVAGYERPADVTPREDVLNEASQLITGDRNRTYGSPTQNFADTAAVWNTILRRKLKDGEQITPGEVAAMMVGLKLVRMVAQPKRDNWVDIAGYAGCGYEADVSSGRIPNP